MTWDEALEVSAKESTSGGIIGKVRIEFGYKVFAKSVSPTRAFFPAPHEKSKDEERGRVLAQARAFAQQYGAGRPQWMLRVLVYRSTAVVGGEPAADRWQDDRQWTIRPVLSGQPSLAIQEFRQSAQNAGITNLPWEGWARLALIQDPDAVALGEDGMTDRDADGNPRFPLIPIIAEVFPSEDAAREAVRGILSESAPAQSLPAEHPPEYDPESWAMVVEEIRQAHAAGRPIAELAREYGVSVNWITKALK